MQADGKVRGEADQALGCGLSVYPFIEVSGPDCPARRGEQVFDAVADKAGLVGVVAAGPDLGVVCPWRAGAGDQDLAAGKGWMKLTLSDVGTLVTDKLGRTRDRYSSSK